MKHPRLSLLSGFLLLLPALAGAQSPSFSTEVEALLATDLEGAGNVEAQQAWKVIVHEAEAEDLMTLLGAIDSRRPLASNWIRSAVETIASRQETLPVEDLKSFVLSLDGDPKARDLGFQLLRRGDAATAEKLIPDFLQDNSLPLRRLSVAERIETAQALVEAEPEAAKEVYREALEGARDVDQIQVVTKALRELGETVDLPKQMGFLTHWQVIGPFDNTDREGQARVFGPEKSLDPAKTHQGKFGEVKWQPLTTADEFGMLDFNKPYGLLKESVAYAMTEYEAPEERDAEIRIGCKNAWKVWLNGELLFERDEYHRGIRIDQYSMPCRLKKGKNQILVKCCQNEQTETWTVDWKFQLRVCDSNGTALLATNRPPTPTPEPGADEGRRRR